MPTPGVTPTSPLALVLLCVCLLGAGARTQTRAQPAANDERTRGVELYRRGDNEGALKALRAATKQHRDDAEAWHYLGLALIKKQKIKDPQKAFETATALRPQFPAALTALAYAHILLGRLDLAGQFAARALQLEPQNAQAHYLLGVVSYRSNALTRALEEAEAALKYEPAHSAATFLQSQALVGLAGRAFTSAGDETPDVRAVLVAKANERLAAATASLDRFLKLNPSSADAALLQEQLKTLRIYGELTTKPASERSVLSMREVTARAIITSKPVPSYTEQARRNNTSGEVVLRLVLGADGTVQYVLPVKTLPDGLTEASIAAARRIKFVPASKDGRPVSQFVTVAYNFNIY